MLDQCLEANTEVLHGEEHRIFEMTLFILLLSSAIDQKVTVVVASAESVDGDFDWYFGGCTLTHV
jgi:hypothetical protein